MEYQKRGLKQIQLLTITSIAAIAGAILLSSCAKAADTAQSQIASIANGTGKVTVSGQLQEWHKIELTLDGPFAHESDTAPNPFLDYRMTVTFENKAAHVKYVVPGYFAADGNAAETSADSGNKWRAILSPNKPGKWTYRISFVRGTRVAINADNKGESVMPYDGQIGEITVGKSTATGRDFRAQGRLQYVGKRYLRFEGSQKYFLKAGADAPEVMLGYTDFDNTIQHKPSVKLLTWEPHIKDWKPGDPTWQNGKGKGLIGALNYLAASGMNVFSFLTYNAGGDGDNVWPYTDRDDHLHFDCSKLAQWDIVFHHAQDLGLLMQIKLQETENDDTGPTALDHGNLGIERKLYLREMIARFGYNLGLVWNLGEENTQTPAQQTAMCNYIRDNDAYQHPRVIHTYPERQDAEFGALIGSKSTLTGASLQNSWDVVHQRTLKWVNDSKATGRPWVVANDEQNPASGGVPTDPGYEGSNGIIKDGNKTYTLDDIRKYTLWGNLMAGGTGVDYYFGYKEPQSDLNCNDFRSRALSWKYAKIALDFFLYQHIPFWQMNSSDALVDNPINSNSKYCFSQPGKLYLVYLPSGGSTALDLSQDKKDHSVRWFNPREGGDLQMGSVKKVSGGSIVSLGNPPQDATQDWVVMIR